MLGFFTVLFPAVVYMTPSFTASVDVVLLVFLDTLQHCNRMFPLKSPSSTELWRSRSSSFQPIHPYTRFAFLFSSLPLDSIASLNW